MSIPSFDLEVIRSGAAARILVSGELDIATVPTLEEAIQSVTAEPGTDLVVDLRAVTFMDSTGLRLLLQTHARSDGGAFGLSIVRGPTQLDRLFTISGVGDVLPLVDAPATG